MVSCVKKATKCDALKLIGSISVFLRTSELSTREYLKVVFRRRVMSRVTHDLGENVIPKVTLCCDI